MTARFKLSDERGFAMVFEVVLVALVLSFVGLALWQANQHNSQVSPASNQQKTTVVSTEAVAESAAKIAEDDFASDIAISAESEGIQDAEFTAAATEATNLEGSFNDSDL